MIRKQIQVKKMKDINSMRTILRAMILLRNVDFMNFQYRIIIHMEERSQNEMSVSMSGWKLKQESLKNQRNYRQLQNRMIILELERQGKIKAIQKKLQAHKKLMEIKMDRFKLKQSIEKNDQSIQNEASDNSRIFKDIRMNRASNIRSRSNQMRESNNKMFKEIKKQRQQNEKMIKMESERQLKVKMGKRNKVRMIQIEVKENIDKFWRNKLSDYQLRRKRQIARNLSMEERKMEQLLNLEKSQAQLLSEIKRAEEMETQLMSMMAEQRSNLNATIYQQA